MIYDGICVEGESSPVTVTTSGSVTVNGASIAPACEVIITKNLKVVGEI